MEHSTNRHEKSGIKLFFLNLWHYAVVLLSLNCMFVLCCLPIVTIGPAITAMCRICCLIASGEPIIYPVNEFWSSFRGSFKQSLAAGLLCIAYLLISFYAFLLLDYAGNTSPLFPLMIWMALAVFLMCMLYVFPQIAMLNLTLKQILGNAMRLMVLRFKESVAAVLLAGLLLIGPTYFWPVTLVLHVFILFSVSALVCCTFAWPGINMYLVEGN